MKSQPYGCVLWLVVGLASSTGWAAQPASDAAAADREAIVKRINGLLGLYYRPETKSPVVFIGKPAGFDPDAALREHQRFMGDPDAMGDPQQLTQTLAARLAGKPEQLAVLTALEQGAQKNMVGDEGSKVLWRPAAHLVTATLEAMQAPGFGTSADMARKLVELAFAGRTPYWMDSTATLVKALPRVVARGRRSKPMRQLVEHMRRAVQGFGKRDNTENMITAGLHIIGFWPQGRAIPRAVREGLMRTEWTHDAQSMFRFALENASEGTDPKGTYVGLVPAVRAWTKELARQRRSASRTPTPSRTTARTASARATTRRSH